MSRRWHRWIPSGAVAAIIAGTVVVTSQAGAVDLPDRTPEDVLAMVGQHSVEAFSGTFEKSTDLGLPELPAAVADGAGFGWHEGDRAGGPGLDGDAGLAVPEDAPDSEVAAEVLELLTGDHTGRVYVGGPQQARFQLVDGMAEQNLVVSGRDVWHYDSTTNAATHLTLPDPAELPDHPRSEHPERPDLPTPEELAAAVVDALEPSTEISVGQQARVAGRDAYTLTLTPRAAESLVDAVRIAVDGETGFPLGVTVLARGPEEPALRLEYTEIDFSAPDASLFDFTPPDEATVEELETPELTDLPREPAGDGDPDVTRPGHPGHSALDRDGLAAALPEVLGEGWGTVVVLDTGTGADALAAEPLLAELAQPVEGGRLLSTALLSVLVTNDGRVLAGAVTPEHLQALADS